MIRRATACLMLAAGSLMAGDAIAQAPESANLIVGEPGPTRPGSEPAELGQPTVGQPDVGQPNSGQPNLGQQDPGQQDPARQPLNPKDQAPQQRAASANPLWGIPLDTLAVTRERPIFSPSRRPPAPPMAAPVIAAVEAPVVEAAEPEQPPFTLLGTVIDDTSESLAIFFSQASNSVIRRRIGEEEAGWILQAIDPRTTTLERGARQVTLGLPARNAEVAQNGEPPHIEPPLPGPPRVSPEPPRVMPPGRDHRAQKRQNQ
ncbi:hypothetical protein RZS28_02375 [Methylocapsa polymorpha]|uniref:General secretion pathway protein N n=1 Tax=Methylocapsa polymorpha TaxID=3080828 RepID=A0ABZ0HTL3_9HYPH|nr:hypothetical protein RZS28_02375 [Methylocapsa sp. RX1]